MIAEERVDDRENEKSTVRKRDREYNGTKRDATKGRCMPPTALPQRLCRVVGRWCITAQYKPVVTKLGTGGFSDL